MVIHLVISYTMHIIINADMYVSMEIDENGFMKDPLVMTVNGKWEKFSED